MQANFWLLTRDSAIGGGSQMPFKHWQALRNLVCYYVFTMLLLCDCYGVVKVMMIQEEVVCFCKKNI